jgi:two-component system nitrogen regulation response regulator NtrX
MKETGLTRVLVVDDERAICEVLQASLQDEGYEVRSAQDAEEGLRQIESFQPHVVLLDIWMPGERDGLDVLRQAKVQYPAVEFLVMSGHGTIETAVKATKLGAWDFIEKPLSMDRIGILIKNIVIYQQERREKATLLNKLRENIALIGNSEPMTRLKQLIARVAPTSSSVLTTARARKWLPRTFTISRPERRGIL